MSARRTLSDHQRTTSLLWWVDTFKRTGRCDYPWFVCGHYQDVKYPDWPENGRTFVWHVPDFVGCGGGRFAFVLREVTT